MKTYYQKKTPAVVTCGECQKPIHNPSRGQKFHKECYRQRHVNQSREWHQRQRAVARQERAHLERISCNTCNLPGHTHCRDDVRTQAPLPCFARDYRKTPAAERDKLRLIPASYLIPWEV